ncbi:MAG TPA: RNA methyltransferase [Blastocatellia bacterium]|jgi:TrmH family RNA methyltransferase|nr:RNA methyltransferase [Blastocatellia bacterium]
MLVEKITSRQNPLVKRFRRVRTGSERHHLFLEGVRLIESAVEAGVHFESVAFTAALEGTERGLALLDRLQNVSCRGAHVSYQVMDAIADTESPQGVAAIVSRPVYGVEEAMLGDPALVVIADQLQDPGNLGSLIRTAEAAGATGLIATRDTVDPFNHKALRASMGAALRVPIAAGIRAKEVAELLESRKITLLAATSAGPQPRNKIEDATKVATIRRYDQADFNRPIAVVLGREATGISPEFSIHVDEFIHIPMFERVESLNVAAAGAIILYEAARQRSFKFDKDQTGEG